MSRLYGEFNFEQSDLEISIAGRLIQELGLDEQSSHLFARGAVQNMRHNLLADESKGLYDLLVDYGVGNAKVMASLRPVST